MRHALHAEWTKLRTLRSTGLLLAGVVVLTVVVSATATGSVDITRCPTPAECHEDTSKLALTGIRLGQVLVVILAVLTVAAEYGTGTILPTLTAIPRRTAVLAAKAVVVTALVVAAGLVTVLLCLAVGRFLLPGGGFTAAHGYPPLSPLDGTTARAFLGTVLYLVLIGLLALGVATAVRETAAALTAVFALLFVSPVVAVFVTDPHWQERIEKWAPMTAGLSIQATAGLDRQPIGPWAGLGVLALYAGAALLLGALVLTRRDF
ncbi:ABC transporter permease [Spirillospora sp. NPDC047279]|uniref:ABC transporter permease n=1 Tax=Spirillospora sp. NPDC047279 TaxID=3155478 RepID=UPI0033EC04D2